MKKSLRLLSPAKLNLFLRVLKKREDGFHEIASLFQAINLVDEIFFTLSEKDQFYCSCHSLENSSNLIVKALQLFRKKSHMDFHVAIKLKKNVPIMAGLGSGSSNAATVLWGINQLLHFPFSIKTIMSWAKELGSDVSFFFSQGSAYCTGKGDIIKKISLPKKIKGFVAKPDFALPTSLVYQHFKEENVMKKRNPQQVLQSFLNGRFIFFNDLQKPAFFCKPEMQKIEKDLGKLGFHTVLMTGSGSGFFCLGDVKNPHLPGISFFPFVSIQRNSITWYS